MFCTYTVDHKSYGELGAAVAYAQVIRLRQVILDLNGLLFLYGYILLLLRQRTLSDSATLVVVLLTLVSSCRHWVKPNKFDQFSFCFFGAIPKPLQLLKARATSGDQQIRNCLR